MGPTGVTVGAGPEQRMEVQMRAANDSLRAFGVKIGLVAMIATVAIPSIAYGIELGMDTGVTLQLIDHDERNILSLGSPAPDNLGIFSVQSTRVGMDVRKGGQLETSLGFAVISEEQFFGGRRSLAHLLFGAAYLQDLSTAARARPFLRLGGQWRHISETGSTALNQLGVGPGVGARWRLGSVLGLRIESVATRWFENSDIRGHWDIATRLGISAYTN